MHGLFSGLCVCRLYERNIHIYIYVYIHGLLTPVSFKQAHNRDLNTAKSIMNVYKYSTSAVTCTLVGLTNISAPYHIQGIGMFQKQHSTNVTFKPRLHKAPAGNRCYNTGRGESSLFLAFAFSRQTEPVQSLLLRRFGIKSRTKTQHILTANHHGDAGIFLKKQKRDGERCSAASVAACKAVCFHPFSWLLLDKCCPEYHYQPKRPAEHREVRLAGQIKSDFRWVRGEMKSLAAQQINNGPPVNCWRCLKQLFALCD